MWREAYTQRRSWSAVGVSSTGMSRRTLVGVTVFFTIVTCVMTYPLVRFSSPVLPDTDDAYFNVWRLSWVAHQLGQDPFELFDSNSFYPQRMTLAYSDAMLALGLIAAPAIALGLHPVLAHNVLTLGAFVTAALGAFSFCRHLTGSTPAALVGGLIFAFAPYRFAHLSHLELLWMAPMPLAVLVLHRAVHRERPAKSGVMLGALVALQAYCSLYYAAFLAIFIGLWTAASSFVIKGKERSRVLRCVIIAGVMALLVTAPYGYVYYRAHQELGPRPVEEIRRYSATPGDYLRASIASKTYAPGPAESHEERSLFPGVTAVSLALYAVIRRRDATSALYGVLAALTFDLSLGLNGLTYPLVSSVVPLLDGLRAPARFSALFLLCLSALAALGAQFILTRLGSARGGVLACICGVLIMVEYWVAPVATRTPILNPPAVYQWLRTLNQPVVLELPVPDPSALWNQDAVHQYMSIFHWGRLVNGYSGHAPPAYIQTLEAMRDFPSSGSIAWLRMVGVQYVIVHERFNGSVAFGALVTSMMASDEFEEPLTMLDPVDPVFVFRLKILPGGS